MKAKLVETGCMEHVDVVAKQLHSQSLTRSAKEKPVTKKMLAEQWHWDELLGLFVVIVLVQSFILYIFLHVQWYDCCSILNI